MQLICINGKNGVKYQYASRAVFAYAHGFGNDNGTRLLEHVRLLERTRYFFC